MSTLKVDTIRNYDSAVDFSQGFNIGGAGIIQNYTESATVPETPTPVNGDYWWDTANDILYRYMDGGFRALGAVPAASFYGDRALFGDGQAVGGLGKIDYIDITTTGNATHFGNFQTTTTNVINHQVSVSGGTRIVFHEQSTNAGSQNIYQTLSKVAPATTGNATDFGDAYHYTYGSGTASNGTLGLFVGGWGRPGSNSGASATALSTMDYITIATEANATDWGSTLSSARFGVDGSGISNTDKALFGGGGGGPSVSYAAQNVIDSFTWTTGSSATDFGDLTNSIYDSAACQSDTRGIWSGGTTGLITNANNVIQYVTIANAGNATDFGDLYTGRTRHSGASNLTRGVFAGGYTSANAEVNTIEYITIANTGNATDFGDLQSTKDRCFGDSGAAS